MFGLITAALWWAWALWGWPRITVDDDIITVRNAMSTWHIPLQEVRHIEGGRALTLTLTDASRVTVAAMSGDGIATEAWRRTDAATEGGHFVRSADDARVSRQAQSAAADWAKQLRLRVDAAPERRDATVQRTPNTLIMLGSIGAVALAALAVTVFE